MKIIEYFWRRQITRKHQDQVYIKMCNKKLRVGRSHDDNTYGIVSAKLVTESHHLGVQVKREYIDRWRINHHCCDALYKRD